MSSQPAPGRKPPGPQEAGRLRPASSPTRWPLRGGASGLGPFGHQYDVEGEDWAARCSGVGIAKLKIS